MIYVISDELYIFGDMIDMGEELIKLVQYLMLYPSIYSILGNHEYMALKVLSKLNVEITENSIDMLQPEDLLNYLYRTQDGGDVTVK